MNVLLRTVGVLAVVGIVLVMVSEARSSDTELTTDLAAQDLTLQFPAPTATPPPPTGTATRTATPPGRPLVEAISNATNVRAGPDINDERLGQIYPGTSYAVIARRFDWYQIEFPDSPNGTGWVYKDVVTLTGDPATITELEEGDVSTVDPGFISIQQTVDYITATPGALMTLTAEAMITPTGVFTADPNAAPTLEPGAPLPTYTPPPFTNTPIVIPNTATADTADTGMGIPPIVPILALGALGLMGLLIGFLRRL